MQRMLTAMSLVLLSLAVHSAPDASNCSDPPREQSGAWIEDHRKTFPDPKAGIAVFYRGTHGKGTVYVFDAGIKDWSEGIADPRMNQLMAAEIEGVKEFQRRGTYSDLEISEIHIRRFFCLEFLFLRFSGKLEGRPILSTTAVTVRGGVALKVRATFYLNPPNGVEGEAESLVRAAIQSGTLQ